MKGELKDSGREADNAVVQSEPPAAEAVRGELEKLLASHALHTAKGQKNFLRYAVEQTVAGRGNEIKESSLALRSSIETMALTHVWIRSCALKRATCV